ncbi:MAG: tyrosine-protein phosphatase [Bacillota bacterium]
MIDLHCHLLPAFDDGARDWTETLEMCQLAIGAGVKIIVATPHWREVKRHGSQRMYQLVAELNQRLQQLDWPLEIKPGCEAMLSPELPAAWRQGKLPGLNGGERLLLELPWDYLGHNWLEQIYQLQLAGASLAIAHPERTPALACDWSKIQRLAELEAGFQITAGSLLGAFGTEAEKIAWRVLKQDWPVAVAGDAHDASYYVMARAYEMVKGKLGQVKAEAAFIFVPRSWLGGADAS